MFTELVPAVPQRSLEPHDRGIATRQGHVPYARACPDRRLTPDVRPQVLEVMLHDDARQLHEACASTLCAGLTHTGERSRSLRAQPELLACVQKNKSNTSYAVQPLSVQPLSPVQPLVVSATGNCCPLHNTHRGLPLCSVASRIPPRLGGVVDNLQLALHNEQAGLHLEAGRLYMQHARALQAESAAHGLIAAAGQKALACARASGDCEASQMIEVSALLLLLSTWTLSSEAGLPVGVGKGCAARGGAH